MKIALTSQNIWNNLGDPQTLAHTLRITAVIQCRESLPHFSTTASCPLVCPPAPPPPAPPSQGLPIPSRGKEQEEEGFTKVPPPNPHTQASAPICYLLSRHQARSAGERPPQYSGPSSCNSFPPASASSISLSWKKRINMMCTEPSAALEQLPTAETAWNAVFTQLLRPWGFPLTSLSHMVSFTWTLDALRRHLTASFFYTCVDPHISIFSPDLILRRPCPDAFLAPPPGFLGVLGREAQVLWWPLQVLPFWLSAIIPLPSHAHSVPATWPASYLKQGCLHLLFPLFGSSPAPQYSCNSFLTSPGLSSRALSLNPHTKAESPLASSFPSLLLFSCVTEH